MLIRKYGRPLKKERNYLLINSREAVPAHNWFKTLSISLILHYTQNFSRKINLRLKAVTKIDVPLLLYLKMLKLKYIPVVVDKSQLIIIPGLALLENVLVAMLTL